MSIESYTTATPRQTRKLVERTVAAGRVPMITSSPGMGKSAIVKQVAADFGLKLIDHRLSTSAPEDLTGLPRFREDGRAEFAPFGDLFPLKGDDVPDGYNGWLLFLDELPSAPKSVQAAAYKLILDRQVGQYDLHEKVWIVAAGNKATDRAIVNPIGTAMQSRLVHIEMRVNFTEWLEDAALPQHYDHRVIAYLSMHESKLLDFDPEHQDRTFCCPRTWEMTSDIITGREMDDLDALLLAGTITSGEAISFTQFTKVYKNLVKFSDIMANPSGCHIPSDTATKWALSMSLVEKTDKTNFDTVGQYIDRFDMSFRVLYFRALIAQKPELRDHERFAKSMVALSRYLNG